MGIINILIWFVLPVVVGVLLLTAVGFTFWLATGWVFSALITVECLAVCLFAFVVLMFKHGIHIQ
jgi:hypothetical protein